VTRLAFAARLLGTASVLLALAAPASAHEYWLMPERFTAAPGERIGIAHRVGAGWPGETLPRDPARVRRFTLVDAQGERRIGGAPGADPAGIATLGGPGLATAVYHSTATSLVLDAAAFESYLREEGLERILEQRAAAGASAAPGRERFVRHAKALIAVGEAGAPAAPFDRAVGLDLELVPETDPRTLAGGGSFAVRLLHLGRPLAGALVKAIPQADGEPRVERRSDEAGRVLLALPSAGVWLINAVHMTPVPPGSDADWQSLWSSLTFALPARSAQSQRSEPGAVVTTVARDERVELWVHLVEPATAPGAERRQWRQAEQARVAEQVRALGGEVVVRLQHARHALLVRIAPARAADLGRIRGVTRVRPALTLHPPELMRAP
jgi:uncharacterized GH25 family protein